MGESDFARRAICFKSNEGTFETECKVDFLETGDSNDERIIISSGESEITSSEESEIEDEREDSEQVCPNPFQWKAEHSFLVGMFTQNNTSISLAS